MTSRIGFYICGGSVKFISAVPCPLRHRVALVMGPTIAIVVGLCVLHPEDLAHPLMPDSGRRRSRSPRSLMPILSEGP